MIAISTAYKEALIGIEIDNKSTYKSLDSSCKHSENMLYSIDQMLDEINKTIKDNDCFAVVIGPGSFTGLRIGISIIKGLCSGEENKTVIPLTTFDLMAYSYIKNFTPKKDFTCIINGLGGYYFVCKYSHDGKKLSEEQMIEGDQLSSFENLIGLKEEGLCEIKVAPTADELLELAKNKLKKCELISAKILTPMYLRKSQAESEKENKKD